MNGSVLAGWLIVASGMLAAFYPGLFTKLRALASTAIGWVPNLSTITAGKASATDTKKHGPVTQRTMVWEEAHDLMLADGCTGAARALEAMFPLILVEDPTLPSPAQSVSTPTGTAEPKA